MVDVVVWDQLQNSIVYVCHQVVLLQFGMLGITDNCFVLQDILD